MVNLFRSFVLLFSLCVVTVPVYAGSLYLTGHDVLLHAGQNGYWRTILDFLRGSGTASEIPEASYSIAFLNSSSSFDFLSMGYTGPVTEYDASVLDDAGWAAVFSHDVIVVPWAPNFNVASRTAFNARSAELTTFFNAGGDLYMNSSTGETDYYTVLPASVASTGVSIGGSSGFVCTPEGVAIGIDCGAAASHINGFPTHNNFTTVAPALTVFERSSDGEAISIGVSDATISGGGIGTGGGGPQQIPTLSMWALVLLVLSLGGIAIVGIRRGTFRS